MNKEQFKLCLMEQVKDPASAFRMFMLNYRREYENLIHGKYLNQVSFCASEFNVDFVVETINKEGDMQVKFVDSDESLAPRDFFIFDITRKKEERFEFALESLTIKGDHILFGLSSRAVTLNNYIFTFDTKTDIEPCDVDLDVSTGEVASPESLVNFLEIFDNIPMFNDILYVEHNVTAEDLDKIYNLPGWNKLPKKRMRQLLDCITTKRDVVADSILVSILTRLYNVYHPKP